MVSPTRRSAEPAESNVRLANKCKESLGRAEEQTELAREMIKTVREMCDRAAEMGKPLHFIDL